MFLLLFSFVFLYLSRVKGKFKVVIFMFRAFFFHDFVVSSTCLLSLLVSVLLTILSHSFVYGVGSLYHFFFVSGTIKVSFFYFSSNPIWTVFDARRSVSCISDSSIHVCPVIAFRTNHGPERSVQEATFLQHQK